MLVFQGFHLRRRDSNTRATPHRLGASMEEHIRSILKSLGEDPEREGLLKTPQRVAEALKYLTRGYSMSPEKVINEAMFSEDYEE
ncbi:MAG: GTP cyclohydrolase I, partial [Deltaproteobacteria bacterium]|nr:GTP cyclohydrolase I [Deltaproteobacteria bacterium]